MSKDVELTDEERRILAEIEWCEQDLRTRLPWTRLERRNGTHHDLLGWGAVAIGAVALVAGLVANLGLVPFAGFLILLLGVTHVTARISLAGWRARLQAARRNLSAPRSGQDGT